MKKILIFIFMIILSTAVYSAESENVLIENQIYARFFENVKAINIPISIPLKSAVMYPSLKSKEVSLFKKELKTIKDVKRYTQDAFYFRSFKPGFYILQVYQKDGRLDQMLFSTESKAMIIREKDLLKERKVGEPQIIVYEFKVSEKVVDILKKYEKFVPKDGHLLTNWMLEF